MKNTIVLMLTLVAALIQAKEAGASYDDYAVLQNGVTLGDVIIANAGDVDGDAQGDLLIRLSTSDETTYIITASTLAGGKSIDLAKAEFVLTKSNESLLAGKVVVTQTDVDGDGRDEIFLSDNGDSYEEGKNDERLILATELENYKNIVQENENTTVVINNSSTPKESVTVGVGVSKDISCSLDYRARNLVPEN